MAGFFKNMSYFTFSKLPSMPRNRTNAPEIDAHTSFHLGGIKRYFSSRGRLSRDLEIRGIGILERMSPGLIKRPLGTGDYLLMLFHDEACIGTKPRWEKTFPLNTMMIWPAGTAHYYGNETSSYRHSWIHCDGQNVKRILTKSKLPVLRPFALDQPALFQQGLSELLAELVAYTRPDPAIATCLLELCLLRLAQSRTERRVATRVPEKLLAVQRMISSVPAEEVTLADMAEMAGMSPPYFCSQFKKIFGTSPMESLINHRLHHAAHLLTNWNLNISEIAVQVGYQDLFHFSKMFRKKFGLSPRKMRARALARAELQPIKEAEPP
ncbi:hypothetical protein BH09VER1_BH09VER1_29230 [soil metagenome]